MRFHPTVGVQLMCDVHLQYLQLANSHDLVVQLIEVPKVFVQYLLVRFTQRVLVVHCALLQVVQRKRPIVVQIECLALAVDLLQPIEYHKAKHSIQPIQSGCAEGLLFRKKLIYLNLEGGKPPVGSHH